MKDVLKSCLIWMSLLLISTGKPAASPVAPIFNFCPAPFLRYPLSPNISSVNHRYFIHTTPIPFSTDSMIEAAITEPSWPPVLAPMACMRRKFFLLYRWPCVWTTLADMG